MLATVSRLISSSCPVSISMVTQSTDDSLLNIPTKCHYCQATNNHLLNPLSSLAYLPGLRNLPCCPNPDDASTSLSHDGTQFLEGNGLSYLVQCNTWYYGPVIASFTTDTVNTCAAQCSNQVLAYPAGTSGCTLLGPITGIGGSPARWDSVTYVGNPSMGIKMGLGLCGCMWFWSEEDML